MTDKNGNVPIKKDQLFIGSGNDSNIYIPIEFNFIEEVTIHHSIEVLEALA